MNIPNNELKAKIIELKNLKHMKSELEAMITDIEDEIKAEMTHRGVDQIVIDECKVTWRKTTRKSVDVASFQELLPDLAANFTKIVEGRRFLVG